jgi:hypothetical protein
VDTERAGGVGAELSYNASIAPGNTYNGVGFTANLPSGSNGIPSAFSLNGVACH